MEQLREEGCQERLKAGIEPALESKYGDTGTAFYHKIENNAALDVLTRIKQALRNGAALHEREQFVQNNSIYCFLDSR